MKDVLLTDICRPKQWKTISMQEMKLSGYPVFGANGIIGYYDKYTHEEPTLLITCRGATCGTMNISLPFSYVNGNAMALDNLDSVSVDLKFLFYYLKNRSLRDTITGTAQPQITRDSLKKVRILLPPLPEQKRIAEVLDKADALREKRRLALQKLETLLQSVFLEMFGDPVKNPKGWDLISINDLVSKPLQNGAYFPKEYYTEQENESVEMVHMSDAFYGIVKRGNLKRVKISKSETEKYQVTSKDLLVARRSLTYEGSVLPCMFPESKEDLIFESSLIRISPDESKIRLIYLYTFLKNEKARINFVFPYVTKSTISGINQTNLAKVKIIVPKLENQINFEKVFWHIQKLKKIQSDTLIKSENLFQSLQQRAFKGELFNDEFPTKETKEEKVWQQTSLF